MTKTLALSPQQNMKRFLTKKELDISSSTNSFKFDQFLLQKTIITFRNSFAASLLLMSLGSQISVLADSGDQGANDPAATKIKKGGMRLTIPTQVQCVLADCSGF